ncbi:MAG TPA: response regulator [Gemmatimonadaceae bacterium]|jgi:FixJ family two-component response regulator|nr:response regulator [Gemmatimonadaceae bacterium]
MQRDPMLVAVIDDDEATCLAVARLLAATGHRVRTFTTARDYLEDLDAAAPSCVLVDIRMPDVDGLALIRAMRDSGIEAPTVFMTGSGHVPTAVEAMKEGAIDLLAKPFSAEELAAVMARAAVSSERLYDERRASALRWRQLERVTPREAEVCALVACGLPNKSVAVRIGTTEKTVKVHRSRVMQKLRASSLAALVRFVDALLADRDRNIVRLDGLEMARPRAADIIIAVTARERAGAAAVAPAIPLDTSDESVDHRAMPRPS